MGNILVNIGSISAVVVSVVALIGWYCSVRRNRNLNRVLARREQGLSLLDEQLNSMRNRHELMLAAVPDIVFRLNRNHEFIDYHAPDSESLAATPPEFLGKRIDEVLPSVAEQAFLLIKQAHATGQKQKFEYAIPIPAGGDTPRHFEARLIPTDSQETGVIIRDITEARSARLQLELMYRVLSSVTNGVIVWEFTPRGMPVNFCNEAVRCITGFSPEEVVRGEMDILQLDELNEPAHPTIRKAFAQRETCKLILQQNRKDGICIWAELLLSPVQNPDGNVTHYVGVIDDVSQRIASNQTIQNQNDLLESILTNISDGVVVCNSEGTLQHMNQTGEQILGIGMTNTGPSDWSGVYGLFQTDGVRQFSPDELPLKRALDGETVSDVEMFVRNAAIQDGLYISVSARPMINADGIQHGAVAVFRDITVSKQEVDSLRQRELHFRELADTAPAMIWISGTDCEFQFINKTLSTFTGYASDRFLGSGWQDFLHPDDFDLVISSHMRAIKKLEPYELEFRLQCADGVNRWVLGRGIPRFSEADLFTGFIGSWVSVDRRKKAEEAQRELNNQLEQSIRMSMMGELSTGLAHELNQPLAAIANFAELGLDLLEGLPESKPEVRQAIVDVKETTFRASELIKRMRRLVKKAQPQRTDWRIDDLIQEALSVLQSELRAAEITVKCEYDPDMPTISADSIQVQQVLINLIRNAIEAIQKTTDSDRRITISCSPEDRFLVTTITDTGVGLPASPEQVYDKFFTTTPHGLGLGLAICRSILESHRGKLTAENLDSGGAAFSFYLPLNSAEQPSDD